jgi:Ca-activated chloride channel family protein
MRALDWPASAQSDNLETFTLMNFGAPEWFWALAVLPLLALLYARAERRSAQMLREFVSPRLLPQLTGNIDRRRRAIRFCGVLLSLALAIAALAQPRWGYTYEDVKRRGLDLLLAVDTSRSMLSNDVAPNRLGRVKLAAQDLVAELNGDRVGLIAFAGRAFLQAPLTIDYDAAIESVNDLDTKTIPEGGTNISEAIALAVRTFGKSAMGNRALVIFTDGEELSGDAAKEAKKAADAGVRIFTIGVGTSQGSLIPVAGENSGGFVKDAKGQVVKSRLDEKRLREIADATSGIYLPLQNGPQTMRQLYEEGLAKLQTGEIDARLSRRPIERYEWPLGAAILLLIGTLFINDRKRTRRGTRKNVPVRSGSLVAASLLIVATQSFGVSGMELYKQGKFDEAYTQFQKDLQRNLNPQDATKMQFDLGTAAFQGGDYDKALEAFSQSLVDPSPKLQENSHYNLGRTLEDRADLRKTDQEAVQDLENSAQHYEQALKLNPQNQAAAKHLQDVRNKIERLKKHPKQPPSPKPQQDQKKNKSDKDQQQQKQPQQQQEQQQQKQDQQNQTDQSQQQAKNNQQQNKEQNQQSQSSNSGKDRQQKDNSKQQGSDKQPNPEKNGQQASPSPSPGESPQAQATPSNKPQSDQGNHGDRSPSDGSNSPSPNPEKSGTSPSPSAGDDKGENGSPSPTPVGSPKKPRSGEIKAAGDQSDTPDKQEVEAAEAEAEKRGEMSPQQAERLLRAMKDEEARVQLDERRPTRPVYNDW